MKRLLALLLALTVCVGTVSGCGGQETLTTHAHEDLTITLPAEAMDLSADPRFADYDFLFACGLVTISGIREERALLRQQGVDPTLQEYTDLLIRAHGLDCQMLLSDGITYFNYEAGDPQLFTYVVTVWETEEAYWTVQAYCRSEDYAAVRDAMWQYLRSITV